MVLSLRRCRLIIRLFSGLLLLAGCALRPNAVTTPLPHASPTATPAVTKPARPLFIDVARKAHVLFTENNGADGHFRLIESTPGGCAFFDYDNDRFPDIVLIQSGPSAPLAPGQRRPHCALFRNDRKGGFTDVTPGSGIDRDLGYAQGVAVGDYDNDGHDDLLITAYGGNHLLHNERGTGKFRDTTQEMGLGTPHSTGYATSAAFGDYDGDGRLDLFICYYAAWKPALNKTCQGMQRTPDYCGPEIVARDVQRLYHNEGVRFTEVTEKAGIAAGRGHSLAVAFLDADGDGRQDIYVANDLTAHFLWRNNGEGTFTDIARQAGVAFAEEGQVMAGMGIALGDYDHSGRESVFVSNFSNLPNTLFQNVGGGVFKNVSGKAGVDLPHRPFLTFGCEFMDYDADGWIDLINANGHVHTDTAAERTTYAQRKQLFQNRGNGKFGQIYDPAEMGDLMTPRVSRGLAVADFDNDGRLDFLVNNQNAPAQLFRNQGETGNHWVSFQMVGTRSNRDACGAQVFLTAGGVTQMASVHSGTSYLSHSDRRVYFGLGKAQRVDALEVRWPGGQRETLRNLQADRFYRLTESKGLTGNWPPGPGR